MHPKEIRYGRILFALATTAGTNGGLQDEFERTMLYPSQDVSVFRRQVVEHRVSPLCGSLGERGDSLLLSGMISIRHLPLVALARTNYEPGRCHAVQSKGGLGSAELESRIISPSLVVKSGGR